MNVKNASTSKAFENRVNSQGEGLKYAKKQLIITNRPYLNFRYEEFWKIYFGTDQLITLDIKLKWDSFLQNPIEAFKTQSELFLKDDFLKIDFSNPVIIPLDFTSFSFGFQSIWQKKEKQIVNSAIQECDEIIFAVYLKNDSGYEVKFSKPTESERLLALKTKGKRIKYLQARLIALESSLNENGRIFPKIKLDAIGQSEPKEYLLKEIDKLDSKGNKILSAGKYELYLSSLDSSPYLLRELGRVREWTFREVGEGTGQQRDLDEFDLYYQHLLLWDSEGKNIVGGYRLGIGSDILPKLGTKGFYVNTLFKFDSRFKNVLKDSLELGRSFVSPEYQKKGLPLLLLWKGIQHFLLENPSIKYVFGPVSISNDYLGISQKLMVSFIRSHYYNFQMAKLVKARKPFKVDFFEKRKVDKIMISACQDLGSLDKFISEIEPSSLKLPVLVKRYIMQNAQFFGFNIDPKFSNSLDGLMLLDVKKLPVETFQLLKN
jgi:hypothetical protein